MDFTGCTTQGERDAYTRGLVAGENDAKKYPGSYVVVFEEGMLPDDMRDVAALLAKGVRGVAAVYPVAETHRGHVEWRELAELFVADVSDAAPRGRGGGHQVTRGEHSGALPADDHSGPCAESLRRQRLPGAAERWEEIPWESRMSLVDALAEEASEHRSRATDGVLSPATRERHTLLAAAWETGLAVLMRADTVKTKDMSATEATAERAKYKAVTDPTAAILRFLAAEEERFERGSEDAKIGVDGRERCRSKASAVRTAAACIRRGDHLGASGERTPEMVLGAMLVSYGDAALVSRVRLWRDDATDRRLDTTEHAIITIRNSLAAAHAGPEHLVNSLRTLSRRVRADYEARLSGATPLDAPPAG